MFFEMMLSAGLLAAVQAPALPEIPLSTEAMLPPDVYLVKAHALTATKGGKQQPKIEIGGAPFEIDHVYVGPGDLKGKTFFATEIHTFVLNFSPSSWYDVTPIRKGEVGIWWIYKGKQRLASVYGTDGSGQLRAQPNTTVFMPALKNGSKAGDAEYEMAVARAQVFEKIYHASDKERLKVIDDYVRSHNSIKGAAALMLLLTGNNPIMISRDTSLPLRHRYRVDKFPKIADYVLPFSKDESLSPRVQWQVEQLLAINKDSWKGPKKVSGRVRTLFSGRSPVRHPLPTACGRPRGRSVLSRPRRRAVCSRQASAP